MITTYTVKKSKSYQLDNYKKEHNFRSTPEHILKMQRTNQEFQEKLVTEPYSPNIFWEFVILSALITYVLHIATFAMLPLSSATSTWNSIFVSEIQPLWKTQTHIFLLYKESLNSPKTTFRRSRPFFFYRVVKTLKLQWYWK